MTEREIFFEALEMATPEARAAYLQGACGHDVTLRRKVDELLKEHFSNDSLLAGPALEGARAAAAESGIKEAPAQMIGRYKLLEKIGEGGFGEVWMAEQREPVKRRVALKIIKPGMDSRQIVARFEAERQALAMMDHANIAKIFDADVTDTGRPYFVMELVRGIKITEYCDQNQLPTRERLDLFIKVCHAIQHAHQKGIIHRDIKPSNILVTLHDGVPVPKVIDFGIAKATQQELTDKTLFTQFQQFMGTPAYISPEQAEMSGLDIDTRADIYSLGVLLYELLVGQTPFDAKEMMQGGLDALRQIIREKEPLPPSTKLNTLQGDARTTAGKRRQTDVGRLVHQLQGDLDWIAMKCLEKDRARRYETANGLAADIQRHMNNEPVVARPPSRWYELQKTVRRHKFGFAAATVLVLVLMLGVVISTWQAVRAIKAEKLANDRLAEAEAISTFMGEVIQSPDPTRDGRTIQVAELLDRAAKKLETELAGQPGRKAKLQDRLGHTYASLGLYREAIPLHEKTRDYYRATSGPEHSSTLRVEGALAFSYYGAGRRKEALKLREEVLALNRKARGPEKTDMLKAMQDLADSYIEAGRKDEAIKLGEEVVTLRRKVNGPEHPDTLSAMHILAHAYRAAGRNAEALQLLEVALPLSRKLNGPEHQATLHFVGCLAISYDKAGRSGEALTMREEVLPLSRKVNGPEHPITLGIMGYIANSYSGRGRWDEALKLREEVLTLCRKALGPEHPDTLTAMFNLAISYRATNRLDEAIQLGQSCLEIRRRVSGPTHPDTLWAMISLAISYRATNRLDEAIELGQSCLEISRRVSGPTNSAALNAMTELAITYKVAGRTAEAIALEEESLRLKRQHLPPGHSYTIESMENLAACYEKTDRKPEAEALRKEVAELKATKSGKAAERNKNTPAEVERAARERVQSLRSRLPTEDPQLDGPLVSLTQILIDQQKFAEAEEVARQSLANREKNMPDKWFLFNTRSVVGGILMEQKKYAEAEPFLLSGHEGLKQRKDALPAAGKLCLSNSLDRLVQLYEATGQPEKVAEWNKKLAEFNQTEAKK